MPNSSGQKSRSLLYYLALLLIFGAGMWLILATGSRLSGSHLNSDHLVTGTAGQSASNIAPVSTSPSTETSDTWPGKILRGAIRSPLGTLLLQIIVIIIAARLFGAVFRRIGQPPVMSEMAAGISLSSSVLRRPPLQTIFLCTTRLPIGALPVHR